MNFESHNSERRENTGELTPEQTKVIEESKEMLNRVAPSLGERITALAKLSKEKAGQAASLVRGAAMLGILTSTVGCSVANHVGETMHAMSVAERNNPIYTVNEEYQYNAHYEVGISGAQPYASEDRGSSHFINPNNQFEGGNSNHSRGGHHGKK